MGYNGARTVYIIFKPELLHTLKSSDLNFLLYIGLYENWCLVLGLHASYHWQLFSPTRYTIWNTNYSFFKFTSINLNQNNVPMIWYSIRGIWRFYRSKNLEGILKGKSVLPSPVSCPELWNPGLEFTWL